MTARMDEASRELAALLGDDGTGPKPPTLYERRVLHALKRAPKGAATPLEMIAADPELFAGTTVAGIHRTAASLVRKGYVKRGRRDSASRLYRITDAGRRA